MWRVRRRDMYSSILLGLVESKCIEIYHYYRPLYCSPMLLDTLDTLLIRGHFSPSHPIHTYHNISYRIISDPHTHTHPCTRPSHLNRTALKCPEQITHVITAPPPSFPLYILTPFPIYHPIFPLFSPLSPPSAA